MKIRLVLIAALVLGCDKKEDTTNPDDSLPKGPTADGVVSCIDRIDEWIQIPNKPPEERDGTWLKIKKECSVLYNKCGGVQTTVAFVRKGNRGLVLDLAGKCIESYCGDFPAPKPRVCDGGTAYLTGTDQDAAATASAEFHKAMVAADLGAGDEWAPLVARLGELWEGYGEVDLGDTFSGAEALGFKVFVTPEGFDLRTNTMQEWIKSGKRANGVQIPATKGKKGEVEYDYAALSNEARKLKANNNEESSVTIVVDDAVPEEVQSRTMEALRGEGCELEPDASPSTVPDGCRFWRQILQ